MEEEDFVRSTRRWYRQGKPERCRRSVRLPEGSSSFSYAEFYSHWSFWSVVFLCLFSRKKRTSCWTSYKWVFFPYDENQVINILFCKNAFLHKWGKNRICLLWIRIVFYDEPHICTDEIRHHMMEQGCAFPSCGEG